MFKIGEFIYPWGSGHYSRMMRLNDALSNEIKDELEIHFSSKDHVYQKLLKKFPDKKDKIHEILMPTPIDGKYLLNNTDIFIGSGGTMTAESALMGVPTISYNAVPNIVENFLVKKHLVKRETNPNKISNYIKKSFELNNNQDQKRAEKIVKQMEDPIEKLIKIIKN